jgi:glucose-1-phosphate cytidylyltransferase
VRIEGAAMVAHVMRIYLRFGFRTFVLAGGYQAGELIPVVRASFGGEIDDGALLRFTFEGRACTVRMIDTGEASPTGERVKACIDGLGTAARFCVTYSDTLADVDLADLYRFHTGHGKIASLLAAQYPTRFRVLGLRLGEAQVRGFAPRSVLRAEPINGGFYIFERGVLDPRFMKPETRNEVLEDAVLDRLVAAQELMAYRHEDAWQNLDSERDLKALAAIVRASAVQRPAGTAG